MPSIVDPMRDHAFALGARDVALGLLARGVARAGALDDDRRNDRENDDSEGCVDHAVPRAPAVPPVGRHALAGMLLHRTRRCPTGSSSERALKSLREVSHAVSSRPSAPRGGKRPAPPARAHLPDYDEQLSGFHRAFEPELQAILSSLPLAPSMKVLDLACGDGFYTRRLADRLGVGGSVTGVDLDRGYLAAAESEAACYTGRATIDFVAASFDRLPFADDTFDVAWCAQSLYSLPEPVVVLGHLARVVRPGGVVAILENDTMHQVFLPWPVSLELPLRAAELRALSQESRHPAKFYVGRRLLAVFAQADLEQLTMATHAIDRQAPFGEAERVLLQCYLDGVEKRVAPFLDAALLNELRELREPSSPRHLLREPHLTMTWLNVLALGRKRAR